MGWTPGDDVWVTPTSQFLESKDGAASSAAWLWEMSGCNSMADAGDIACWRKRINAKALGLAEVTAFSHTAMQALGPAPGQHR